jgi:hypothetical protein
MPATAVSAGHDRLVPQHHVRRATRVLAVTLAVLALGFGIDGLFWLTPETWGVGLIAFGGLLALISLLAQAAEHFARASAEGTERRP